jgi:ankyrin repeat protein
MCCLRRVGHEEKVSSLMKQEKSLKDRVHSLWTTLTDSNPVKKDANAEIKLGHPEKKTSNPRLVTKVDRKQLNIAPTGTPLEPLLQWRIDILKQFSAALVYNEEDVLIRSGISKESIDAERKAKRKHDQLEKKAAKEREKEASRQKEEEKEEVRKIQALEKESCERGDRSKQNAKRMLKSQSMTSLPCTRPLVLVVDPAPPVVQSTGEKRHTKKIRGAKPRPVSASKDIQETGSATSHIKETKQKSSAIVTQMDALAAHLAQADSDALKYTHHHLFARHCVEKLLATAITDVSNALSLKHIDAAGRLADSLVLEMQKRYASKEEQFLEQEQELLEIRKRIEADEIQKKAQQEKLKSLQDEIELEQRSEREKEDVLLLLQDEQDGEAKLFDLIFEEARRLQSLVVEENAEIRSAEDAIGRLTEEIEAEEASLESAEDRVDALGDIVDAEEAEIRAKHEVTEQLAAEWLAVEDEVQAKLEEVRRLSEISVTGGAYFISKDEAESLVKLAETEADELQQQEIAIRLLAEQAQKEEAQLREKEAETLRLKAQQEERVLMLQRREEEALRLREEMEFEVQRLREIELENERILAAKEREIERIRQLELETESRRLHAEKEAREAQQKSQELRHLQEIAEQEARELQAKEEAELEIQRLMEQEARELHIWQQRVDDCAAAACLFAAEQTIQELVLHAINNEVFDDPWACIGLEPVCWLAADTLGRMHRFQEKLSLRKDTNYKNVVFKVFKTFLAVKRIQQRRKVWCLQAHFAQLHTMFRHRRLERVKALQIQSVARDYVRRKNNSVTRAACIRGRNYYEGRMQLKAYDCLKYWRYLARTTRKGEDTVFALKDRRFIKTYYTWLHVFKQHKKHRLQTLKERTDASVVIQSLGRVILAKRVRRQILSRALIVSATKTWIARREVSKRRQYCYRVDDCINAVSAQTLKQKRRILFVRWLKAYQVGRACHTAQHTIDVSNRRAVLKNWKYFTAFHVTRRMAAATRIQACVRRRIVIKVVFDFYRWRRCLCRAQGLVRKCILQEAFAITLYVFRSARRIQKVWRGSRIRARMTESRIVAMHYAAAHNNYDRLYYFVSKFPEIVSELDVEGNTALHNAAMNASRRTLKLLLRYDLNPNAYNLSGYTPLHLVIMSNAVSRDDCCLYMLEHGFDEDQLTRTTHMDEGKSCLLLACEYGRTAIVKQLLAHGMNPNTPDHLGATCLQYACQHGYLPIVRMLIDHDAYVNAPGYGGSVPLHDCISSGDIEVAKLLLQQGAYLNVYDPFNLQSPLMYACMQGLTEIAKMFLLAGADSHAMDISGKTVAHFAAMSNQPSLFFVLHHEADVDFNVGDSEGNTPLHIATIYHATEFVTVLLHGLIYPSHQNKDGDQPSHLAARQNYVDILTVLVKYDEHIGRVNLHHQTPLGVAKYFGCKEAQEFLESRFTKLDDDDTSAASPTNRKKKDKNRRRRPGSGSNPNVRNVDDGHIWWDKDMDMAYQDWSIFVSELGERIFTNVHTGEIRHMPPVMSVDAVIAANQKNEISLRKNVEIVRDGGYSLTKHDYLLEHAKDKAELEHYLLQIRCATLIGRYMRRKLAYLEVNQMRRWKRQTRILARFVRNNLPFFKARRLAKKQQLIIHIQARYRGYIGRKRYFAYPNGLYYQYQHRRFTLQFKRKLWSIWRAFKLEKLCKIAYILRHIPQSPQQWQEVVWRAKKPTRVVGMFEEFLYPGTKHIHFYRHRVKHTCSFEKPPGLLQMDEERRKNYELMRLFGYTPAQYKVAVKLQALWRGYHIRAYFIFIEKAMAIYLNAERNYMTNPNDESYLYNYTLYVHAVEQDYVHARELYAKSVQKMESRGPDIAFILYAYAIFSFVTHDQDYSDICILLDRARAAELYQADVNKRKMHETHIDDVNKPKVKQAEFRFGRVFDLASVGFFRYSAVTERTNNKALAWHNLAACLFLVSNDFEGSFDSFLQAFRFDPTNKQQKSNFDTMMEHFHGSDKDYLVEIVKERMQKLAARDSEIDNLKRQKVEDFIKNRASTQIQVGLVWFDIVMSSTARSVFRE